MSKVVSINRITHISLLLPFFFLWFSPSKGLTDEADLEWFKGGTLHSATVAVWKRATDENKLATSSDWLSGTLWKGELTSMKAFERLKEKASMLVLAVDHIVEDQEIGEMQVREFAAAVITMSNDLGP